MITIRIVPTKLGKKQLNLWLSDATITALENLAPQFHLRGRTQVAEVIIERFLADLGVTGLEVGEPAFEADQIEDKLGGVMTEFRGRSTSKTPQSERDRKRGKNR